MNSQDIQRCYSSDVVIAKEVNAILPKMYLPALREHISSGSFVATKSNNVVHQLSEVKRDGRKKWNA